MHSFYTKTSTNTLLQAYCRTTSLEGACRRSINAVFYIVRNSVLYDTGLLGTYFFYYVMPITTRQAGNL